MEMSEMKERLEDIDDMGQCSVMELVDIVSSLLEYVRALEEYIKTLESDYNEISTQYLDSKKPRK